MRRDSGTDTGAAALDQLVVASFARGAWADADGGSVSAEVLARLLLAGPTPTTPTTPTTPPVPALRLRNAIISGRLDLAYADVTFPVQFERCTFDEAPRLTGASTRSLEFVGCELPGLEGGCSRCAVTCG